MKYKIELHSHTSEVSPCACVRAAQSVEMHAKCGYHAMTITDHLNTRNIKVSEKGESELSRYLSGYRAALEAGKKHGIKIYFGAEIAFDGDSPREYLIFGQKPDDVGRIYQYLSKSMKDFRVFAADNGIKIFQAHPFRKGHSPVLPSLLDGIEIFNGHPRHASRNDITNLFATHNELKGIAGSDFHDEECLDRSGIMSEILPEDEEQLARLLMSDGFEIITKG